jgi:hypothetical protein
MKDVRFRVALGMILAAAAVRLLPHAPNFTPIGAMALFGAARFRDLRMAFLAPLATLALSQIPLGFLPWFPVVALAFVLEGFLGLLLRKRRGIFPIAGTVFAGSLVFYLVTNFAVWARSVAYGHTLAGLAMCYAAGIPFFWNTLGGDAFYSAVLFGGFALAEQKFAALREPAGASSV